MAGKYPIGAKGGSMPQPGMKRPLPFQAGKKPVAPPAYGKKKKGQD